MFDSTQYCKAGDAFQLYVTIQGVPVGQILTKAWLTLKVNISDVDLSATLQKAITTTNVAGTGQITDDATDDHKGALRFDLTPSDTAALSPGVEYYYDIQVKTSDATMNIFTVDSGKFHVEPQITLSSS